MAELKNDAGSMRWVFDIVDREAPAVGPIKVVTEDGREPQARLLATSAVEFLDRRDHQFWPFIRLPAIYLGGNEIAALADGVAEVVRGNAPGFAWRVSNEALGIQLGLPEAGTSGPFVVEIGVDLAVFLSDVAGAPRRTAAELALFRFTTTQAELVKFGDELRREAAANLA